MKHIHSSKMDKFDQSESEYLHQTFISHFNVIFSYFEAIFNLNNYSSNSFNQHLDYIENLIMKPSTFFIFISLLILLIFTQTFDFWLNIFFNKLPFKLITRHFLKTSFNQVHLKNIVYELKANQVGIYALQGRRPHMEDQFSFKFDTLNGECQLNGRNLENLKQSKSLNHTHNFEIVAVFDGHGGVTASNYAQENLLNLIKKSFDDLIVQNNQCRELNVETISQLITEQILKLDSTLCELLKNSGDIAGTTCLIAIRIINTNELIVVNIGDSRGILCDSKGNTIALSHDHKPNHPIEYKRIYDSGGFVRFNGVWRVAGILACSRALGDFPLKEKNYVIANPDILKFDLEELKPKFLILASDGLFDFFTNEDAVKFVKHQMELLSKRYVNRKNELSLELAKLLALEAFKKGSSDNITVVVWIFDYEPINETIKKKSAKQSSFKEVKVKKAEELEESTKQRRFCKSRFQMDPKDTVSIKLSEMSNCISDEITREPIKIETDLIKSPEVFSEFSASNQIDLSKEESCEESPVNVEESANKKKKCKKEEKKNKKYNLLNLELNLKSSDQDKNENKSNEDNKDIKDNEDVKLKKENDLDNNANSIRLKDEYNLVKSYSPKKSKDSKQFKLDSDDEFYDCK